MTTPNSPPAVPQFLIDWFAGKTRESLHAIEAGGRTLWPDTIKRRKAGGAIEEVPCMLRAPSTDEKGRATLMANEKIAKRVGIKTGPLTRDQAASYVGIEAYTEYETVALMSLCVLEPKPQYAQMYLYDFFADVVPVGSLYDVYTRVDYYAKLEDVRISDLSEEMFLALVKTIAKVENLSPLVAIGGYARDSFIASMAVRLQSCLTQPSCSPSPETSTPEPSPPTS